MEVYENRKVYSRKVGKLTPKEYNELGHSVAKKLIPAIFKNKDVQFIECSLGTILLLSFILKPPYLYKN